MVPTLALRTPCRIARVATCAAASLVLVACSTLLPTSRTEVVSGWNGYDEASASITALAPYVASRQAVHDKGLDPHRNPAVTVLHFADVLQRFAAATLIRPEDVDPGIRDCLQAGKRCSGYAVKVEKLRRERVGNFWLDSLSFKRETVTTGWRIEALLVFVDDALVYQLIGGHPVVDEVEVRRNPLGPLQAWGDATLRVAR
jgi:hypothetical protein